MIKKEEQLFSYFTMMDILDTFTLMCTISNVW